jgi:hypothetical protein
MSGKESGFLDSIKTSLIPWIVIIKVEDLISQNPASASRYLVHY